MGILLNHKHIDLTSSIEQISHKTYTYLRITTPNVVPQDGDSAKWNLEKKDDLSITPECVSTHNYKF